MFRTILVPTDGSELSDKPVTAAIEYAQALGSKIVALTVAEPYPFAPLYQSTNVSDATAYEDRTREAAQARVGRVTDAARAVGVECESVVAQSFSPSQEILAAAKKFGCDAIFMASHGRKGLNKLFLGSETQKVLAHTELPVMVFR